MSENRRGDAAVRVRLHKYIASCGVSSRRNAEILISEGRVKVNGELVTEMGVSIDPANDEVKVDGEVISEGERGVILLHKPEGVVTTMHDPEGRRTVAHFLTPRYRGYFPVGRLDQETTGLVILTNDGDLAEKLAHPRFGFSRVYHAKVSGRPSDETLAKMESGVKLEDGMASCKVSIRISEADWTELEVTVREGRNRLVRRIFDAVGHPVIHLSRQMFGPFRLKGIRDGEIKKVTHKEYLRFRAEICGAEKKDPEPLID